jgi:hypothetical protein
VLHADRYRTGNVAAAEPTDGGWMVTWRLDPDDLRGTAKLPLSAATRACDTAAEAIRSPSRGSQLDLASHNTHAERRHYRFSRSVTFPDQSALFARTVTERDHHEIFIHRACPF